MSLERSKTDLLKSSEFEYVKQYQLLDAFGRSSKIYTAPVYAKTGDPCLVTEILYQSDTTTIVRAKKEGYTTWDTSFVPDSLFVLPTPSGSKTALIKTNDYELTKQYQELDSEGRPFRIYSAAVFAETGTPCKVTEYVYQNATSTIFRGKKEGEATWDASFVPDSSFTVGY
jgi:hypothetical protein